MLEYVIVAGIATGLLLGLMGSGGAIVTVPALLYLLHVEPKSAIAMSLGIVAITAGVSALREWRRGNVNLRITATFGLLGAIGTFLGARLGVIVPATLQLTLFAIVMYIAAWRMLRARPVSRSVGAAAVGECGGGGVSDFPYRRIALYGIGVGLLAGVVGVGGGFLIVPALVLLLDLPMNRAVGTSLSIVTVQASAGFLGYMGAVPIDYVLMASFTGVAVIASFFGASLGRRISGAGLKRAFGVFLVLVATDILIKSLL